MNLSAVLLAGGESRRMGADKATILVRGKPLWQIQLDLLRKLQLTEIFVSAREDPSWRPPDITFVPDDPPSRGPLSGLAAVLDRIRTKHLLVLAIDMPFINEEHLRHLCGQIAPGCGVLPMIDDRAEPLAAIYPIESGVDVVTALSGADFSMQTLTNRLVKASKLRVVQVSDQERSLYRNLNEPADMQDANQGTRIMDADDRQLLESSDRDVTDETTQPKTFWRENIKIVRRIIVGVVGTTVLLIGVALLVLPGPAFIVIPVGLAILATEFAWARHWLKNIRQVANNIVSRKTEP